MDFEQQAEKLETEYSNLEKFVKETAKLCSKTECRVEHSRRICADTADMIRERQRLVADDCSNTIRKDISKMIQARLKKDLRVWKQKRINERLEAFTDLKSIGNIRRNGRKPTLTSIKRKGWALETSRQGIADVYATFYEDLYKSRTECQSILGGSNPATAVPEVTNKEITDELQKRARKKSSDKAGIVVEMLQYGSTSLRSTVAKLFTDILTAGSGAPGSWKKSYVSVLFKKGDQRLPDNYRPITLLPILYELFAGFCI